MSKVLIADFGSGPVEICTVAGLYGLNECRALIINAGARRVELRDVASGTVLFEASRYDSEKQFAWRSASMGAPAFASLADAAEVVK